MTTSSKVVNDNKPTGRDSFQLAGDMIGLCYENGKLRIMKGNLNPQRWVTQDVDVDWYQLSSLSKNRIGVLTKGILKVKELGRLDASWDILYSEPNKPADTFQLWGQRVAVLAQGTLIVKEGNLNAPWVTQCSNVQEFQLSDYKIAVLINKDLLIKDGGLDDNDWVSQYKNVEAFQLWGNRVAVLVGKNLFVKEGYKNTSWTCVYSFTAFKMKFQLWDDRIAVLDGNILKIKQGNLDAYWGEDIYGGLDSFQLTNNRIGVNGGGGELKVKEGTLSAEWVTQMQGVGVFQLEGNRIGYIGTDNLFQVKENSLYAEWQKLATPDWWEPSNWMQKNLRYIGNYTLRNLCMLGSHDSGMSRNDSPTAGASNCNIITQTNDILKQLHLGVRYFDIRPIIGGGKFYTGHYSYVDSLLKWQGGRGQSIDEIINQINDFCSVSNEVIVLELSHSLDTDAGRDYPPFNKKQWYKLFEQLSKIKNLFKCKNVEDLTEAFKINDFIGSGHSSVIIVIRETVDLDQYQGEGFYKGSQYPMYNEYSNTNDLSYMINDQKSKMCINRIKKDSQCFLLSWTLTQNGLQAVTCAAGVSKSILQLSDDASYAINRIINFCTKDRYPNVISIDNVGAEIFVMSVVMDINMLNALY